MSGCGRPAYDTAADARDADLARRAKAVQNGTTADPRVPRTCSACGGRWHLARPTTSQQRRAGRRASRR